jgi:ABC-type polysaccharide/polyol phosphate transport system ATPase subunit
VKSIALDHVSKKFVLRHTRPRTVVEACKGLFRKSDREDFWALKDLDFTIDQGEQVGIIGHNGAGKSTTLKLLTRIMEPTKGRVHTRGRVTALIEIGAGFHPEMTGMENIYLNGSILGMTKAEINRKLDAIIAFADIGNFLDTPVKRYSSGMQARLGFAVAAHIDPDILLVDEVLSVGDERFQVKCQEYMSKLVHSGVTVIFVSHNLPAVAAICPRSIVIHRGQQVFDGPSVEAIRTLRRLQAPVRESGTGVDNYESPIKISAMRVVDEAGNEIESIKCGDRLRMEASVEAAREVEALNFGIEIARSDGVVCYDVNSRMDEYLPDVRQGGFKVRFEIPKCTLLDGVYSITMGIMDRNEHIHYHGIARGAYFTVVDDSLYRGVAKLGHTWSMTQEP